ncbi:Zinc finger, RING-type [Olea europaea subsp. europaea]|uniref:Zinc finger, RING-type n=2 Tax=Olea europaea subsp. europaea TaxID=158383 RepID=A0A8S0RDA5_OLEEU|nr:Zinc finger, RING-type [Olea europaea subsp. europaea]
MTFLSLIINLITALKFLQSTLIHMSKQEKSETASEHRPSPLLVPVPIDFSPGSINGRDLPMVECSRIIKKLGSKDNFSFCAVCLNFISGCDKVRELGNCFHVFHRECIDAWIDKGKETCPICRSNMLPDDQREKFKCNGEDPWRRERMIYLFGEDLNFH